MKKFSKEDINAFVKRIDFSKFQGGIVPVIAQDYQTNEVLMLAFANEQAVRLTLETGYAHYYSRSRNSLWKKGESSEHVQEVVSVLTDCDNDSILLKVKQMGAACHEGYYSCFFTEFKDNHFNITQKKVFDPKEVYKK